jgi:hypothetical protein
MAHRAGLGLEGDIVSDTAPLHELAAAVLQACPELHAMRDPTRGGVAATLVEIATRRRLGIEVDEARRHGVPPSVVELTTPIGASGCWIFRLPNRSPGSVQQPGGKRGRVMYVSGARSCGMR